MAKRVFSFRALGLWSELLSLATCLALAGALWGWSSARSDALIKGKVAWVYDGDTYQIEGHGPRIRLWGVDTPERGTALGDAAYAFVKDRLTGKQLTCRRKAVDRYQRTVARCDLEGQDLGVLILEAGHGQEMCRFTRGALGTC